MYVLHTVTDTLCTIQDAYRGGYGAIPPSPIQSVISFVKASLNRLDDFASSLAPPHGEIPKYRMHLNFCGTKLSRFSQFRRPSANSLICEYCEQVLQSHKTMDAKQCPLLLCRLCIG